MKKLLSLLVLTVATSVSANPETMAVLVENSKGDRLLGDASTFKVRKNKHGILTAAILSFWASNPSVKIVWAVDVASCAAGQGELVSQTEDQPVNRYFWQKDGNRVYDGVARELCSASAAVMKEAPSSPPPSKLNGLNT